MIKLVDGGFFLTLLSVVLMDFFFEMDLVER